MTKKREYNPGYSIVSTELFNGKNNIPEFIKLHPVFKESNKIRKVFPSIGIPNFREETKLEKRFDEVNKEGSFAFNLLTAIQSKINDASYQADTKANKLQYLQASTYEEYKSIYENSIPQLKDLKVVCNNLSETIDPYRVNTTIVVQDGLVNLILQNGVQNSSGKIIFKKSSRVFSVYNKIKEQLDKLGISIPAIDAMPEGKNFSKENIANKKYDVVFSSEGPVGAWDIATMSMRGIKSCQRWDGEYPKCLVGSIVSKFTGIIYITSGADFSNGGTSMGEKMLARSIVRFVYNSKDKEPMIIVDRMYPNFDKEIRDAFVNALKSRTKFKVKFVHNSDATADQSENMRIRSITDNFYDKKIEKIFRSYHDTPIKSKLEMLELSNTFAMQSLQSVSTSINLLLKEKVIERSLKLINGEISGSKELESYIIDNHMNGRLISVIDRICNKILSFTRTPFFGDNITVKVIRKTLIKETYKNMLLMKKPGTSMNSNMYAEIQQFMTTRHDSSKTVSDVVAFMLECMKDMFKEVVRG
jgi:hypothetical protein